MALQVYVRGHEERTTPKQHTVYRIEVQASVRSWTIFHRYSDFVELNTELTKSTASPPPAPLPPKHTFSLRRTIAQSDSILEERRSGLEAYLRAIVASKNPVWRDSFAFRDFLSIPISKQSADPNSPAQFSSTSWIDEHADLTSLLRDARADLNKRDALLDKGDPTSSHSANVEAKKKLAAVLLRITPLEKGLESLAKSGLSDGEIQRRTEMTARLRDECDKLGRMVVAARQASKYAGPASSADRDELLSGANPNPSSRPFARVFGQGPAETTATRPLDDPGLLQLQKLQMEQQDEQLDELTAILRRQKDLGIVIGEEIAGQIELLDDLNDNVDRVGGKLTSAKKQLNRLD